MLTMGIDSGSAMTKAVLFDGQEIVDFRMEPSGSTPGRVIHRLYEELRTPDTAFVVATGYGRALLPEADKSITEITCHGAGAAFLCPGCDTVIDIGGQDSKVILLDPSGGQVKDFLMNDKCAAGTGRFLEMTMSRVGSDITSIDTFVEGAEPVTINSMCLPRARSSACWRRRHLPAALRWGASTPSAAAPPSLPKSWLRSIPRCSSPADWPSRRWCGRCWPGIWT